MPLTHCALINTSLFCILHVFLWFIFYWIMWTWLFPLLLFSPITVLFCTLFLMRFLLDRCLSCVFFPCMCSYALFTNYSTHIAKYYNEMELNSRCGNTERYSCICIIYKDIFCVLKWRIVVYEIWYLDVTLSVWWSNNGVWNWHVSKHQP